MKRREFAFFTAAAVLLFVMLACVAVLVAVITSAKAVLHEIALALLIGGLLTGLAVLWGLRRYRRVVREEAISEAREVLSDVIKNRLTAITLDLEKHQRQRNRTSLEKAKTKLKATAAWVDSFSEATLEEWKDRYEEATPGRGETTRSKRSDDRRWMLQWLAREKPSRYNRRRLSHLERLRLAWRGLRGGLVRFRESIQESPQDNA